MRSLVLFLLRHPVFATMVLLVPAAGSIMIARNVPLALAPRVAGQNITVSATWPDASPESLETEIVSRIEQGAAMLRGVVSVSSVSRRGNGTVSIELDTEADLDAARFAMQDGLRNVEFPPGSHVRVDAGSLYGSSPSYLDDPIQRMLARFGAGTTVPFMLRLSSDDPDWLQSAAHRDVRNALLALPHVSEVSVSGGQAHVVEVVFRPEELLRLFIGPSDLASGLGLVTTDGREVGLHTEFGARMPVVVRPDEASVEEIREIEVRSPFGVKVALDEVATVARLSRPPEDRSRVNGEPALLVQIERKAEANLIEFSRSIREAAVRMERRLGERLSIEILSDEGAEVERLLSDLARRLAASIAAVMLALLLFFRQLRPSLLVFGGLALTLVIAVAVLALVGVALSMITVAALVLASGMLVDNSLVIYEHLHGSRGAVDVAERSALVLPVIGAASLTNVVVFVPFLFFTGTLRALLVPFAVTMLVAVGASVLVSIIAVPFLFYHLSIARASRRERVNRKPNRRMRSMRGVARTRLNILPLLRWRRMLLPAVLAATVYVFVVLFPALWGRTTYTTSGSNDSVSVTVRMLSDARVEETDEIAGEFERIAIDLLGQDERVDELQVVADIHRTRATVRVLPRRSGSQRLSGSALNALLLIEQQWMAQMGNYVSVGFFLTGPSGTTSGGSGTSEGSFPLGGNRVQVTGYDYALLKEHVIAFSRHMERIPHLYGLDNGFEREERILFGPSFPGFDLYLDQAKITAADVDRHDIVRAIEAYDMQGRALAVRLGEMGSAATIEIAPEQDTRFFRMEELLAMPLSPRVRLGDVAELRPLDSATAITRENQRYVHTISYRSRPLQHEDVRAALTGLMEYYPLPAGFTITFADRYSTQQEVTQRSTMGLAALAGAALVFMVLAGHFESFASPFLVFLSIPLALVATLVGYSLLGTGPDIGGLLGMILLAGIAVNDAILFTAETVRLESRGTLHRTVAAPTACTGGFRRALRSCVSAPIGRDERIAAIAIRHRLRPILVTSFTTVIALAPSLLVPVAENDLLVLWREFAFVVVVGIAASTLATVLIIPLIHIAGRRLSLRRTRA